MKIIECSECQGTGHGNASCGRNPYFGCEECDGMGEVKIEDDEE